MADPINFAPKPADPKIELQRRLAAAPIEHAEALIAACDLLGVAHRQGLLGVLQGTIGAKDTILGLLAKYSAEPANANVIRNLLALEKLLGKLDPDTVSKFAKELSMPVEHQEKKPAPPTLWQLFKRARRPEVRRGLSIVITTLTAMGRAAE